MYNILYVINMFLMLCLVYLTAETALAAAMNVGGKTVTTMLLEKLFQETAPGKVEEIRLPTMVWVTACADAYQRK